MKKRAYNSGLIETKARIVSSASVVGRAEFSGPLSAFFDLHDNTDRFGQATWEQAESEMQRRALSIAIKKAGASIDDIGAIYAGDLLNQCVGAAYGLSEYGVPYFGLYGACSTSAEALTLGAMTVSGGFFDLAAAVTSSHNCSAERQFRYPLNYGGQRPPTAQWTVTGSGSVIVSNNADENKPKIKAVTFGLQLLFFAVGREPRRGEIAPAGAFRGPTDACGGA